jgi:hypothetical protein
MKAKLDEQKVNVRVKLAALWASFMFFYIYVDYFGLYKPEYINNILAGKVFTFDITQTFLITGLALTTIPALMIFFSVALPAKVSRLANIIVATIYIPYTLFNLVGEFWLFMVYGALVEVVILLLVIDHARKWPALKK